MNRYRPTLLRKDSVSERWTTGQTHDGESARPGRPNTITLPTTRPDADPKAQMAALKGKFLDLSKEDLLDLINQFQYVLGPAEATRNILIEAVPSHHPKRVGSRKVLRSMLLSALKMVHITVLGRP